ncbi:MAG: DUF2225 domain-containing protein [Planctomycetes bacterium]|nr:DUF2225 domain-containing protein [Planctomycetota bacterium]
MLELDRNLILDEETAIRLKAIGRMFQLESKREIPPLAIVSNALARLHTTLLQSRPAYGDIYNSLRDAADAAAAAAPAMLLNEYPVEFQDLNTGIDSVLLKRKFRCPMCGTAFTAPMLKTGSLVARFDNRTQLDVYTGVRQDSEKEFVDFSLFLILVCPGCLYAAPEREFDIWDGGAKEPGWKKRQKNRLPRKVQELFLSAIPRRQEIARRAARQGHNLFSTARSEADAAVAIDLATDAVRFIVSKVSPNRKAELVYQEGVLNLMKSLQFERELENELDPAAAQEVRKLRLLAIRDALAAFNRIPEQSVENFDIRESIRYHARRFWAAHELRDSQAFALSGAALQRLNNQFVSLVKKGEHDIAAEDAQVRKLNEEIRKASNTQKREGLQRQVKEHEANIQLLRAGLENARSVLRVVTPVYDRASILYDKFKEIQRQRKMAGQK